MLTPPCFLPDSFVIFDVVSWWKITDASRPALACSTSRTRSIGGGAMFAASQRRAPLVDAYSQPGRNASVSLTVRF